MSFPRYPEYKDSGVEWLGEVPAHWDVTPLKHVAEFASGGTPDKRRVDYWDGDVPWASAKDMKSNLLLDTADHINATALTDRAASLVPAGTVLVVVRGMILARVFPVVTAGVPMAINQDLKAVRARAPGRNDWLAWLLRASEPETLKRLDEAGHGTKALRMDAWADMRIPVPDAQDQEVISRFLDQETAKIDALVEEQQRLIELLKEKRQAAISQAVTKGLDPNMSMKDSGVEWLGKVPAHWEITRLKFVATVQTGIAKGKDNAGKETVTVPYLRVANVQDGHIDLTDVAAIEISAVDLPRYLLRRGDVLMNEGGDFDKLGRGHVWDASIDPCIHQNHVFAVRPATISPEWLNLFTGTTQAQFYFMSRSKQSTNLASISSTNVMELPVVVPPPDESARIAGFVADLTGKVDALIDEAARGVQLLKDRRSALISAAVTGKIDVRKAA